MDFNNVKINRSNQTKKESNINEESKNIQSDNGLVKETKMNLNQFNINNNFIGNNELNFINLRKKNNLLSNENKTLKIENTDLENKIQKTSYRVDYDDSIMINKKNLKNIINKNSLLAYKILNDIKDISSLNKNISKNKIIYNNIRMDKLYLDKIILKKKKEELELKIIELKNKNNNLEILYNSGIQKKNNDKEIISKLTNIVEHLNYKNNYINNTKEAYEKLDLLLNEKHKLIEENINAIQTLNNININKNNNIEEEKLTLLRTKNIKLKNKLNKYDIIIKKINILMENSKYKNSLLKYKIIDNELTKVIEENANIDKEIEKVINKYKKIIQEKNKIFEKLKVQYIKLNKDDIISTDNLLI